MIPFKYEISVCPVWYTPFPFYMVVRVVQVVHGTHGAHQLIVCLIGPFLFSCVYLPSRNKKEGVSLKFANNSPQAKLG